MAGTFTVPGYDGPYTEVKVRTVATLEMVPVKAESKPDRRNPERLRK